MLNFRRPCTASARPRTAPVARRGRRDRRRRRGHARRARGRQVVCQPRAGSGRVRALDGRRVPPAAFLLGTRRARDGAGRGLRLRRWLRADARRRGAFPRAHEPRARTQRTRLRRRRAAGRHHGRPPGGGTRAGTLLSARSREPEKQHARGQHRHQRGRAALPEIRRHATLRSRAGSRAGDGRGRALRRAYAQEQNRLRSRGPVRGQRGTAGRGHGERPCACCRMPPARAAISCGFIDMAAAAAAVQAVFAAGWLPAALEIADRFTLEAARGFLGAENVPAGDAHLLVELDGREASLRGEVEELRALLADAGAISPQTALGDGTCEALWNCGGSSANRSSPRGLVKLNEDIVVPRGRLVDLIDFGAGLQKPPRDPGSVFRARGRRQHPRQPDGRRPRPARRARARRTRAGRTLHAGHRLGRSDHGRTRRRGWRSGAGGRSRYRRKTARCTGD